MLDERLQQAAAARDYYNLLQAIAPLHRTIRNLHATLQQARELLPADRDLINLRDNAGELERTVELLHHDIDNGLEFTAAREAEDERIRGCIEGRSEADLAATFTYTPITVPRPVTQPLAPALFHFFNHQTHHRGQAHAVLTGLGRDAPALDLIYFQRETGIGLAA